MLSKGRDYFTEDEKGIVAPLFKHAPNLKLAYDYSQWLTAIFNSKIKETMPQKNSIMDK